MPRAQIKKICIGGIASQKGGFSREPPVALLSGVPQNGCYGTPLWFVAMRDLRESKNACEARDCCCHVAGYGGQC
jgi:hypothetical protein